MQGPSAASRDAYVACNDDARGFHSSIAPTVTASVTYTIVVDSYDPGDFTLTVMPAP